MTAGPYPHYAVDVTPAAKQYIWHAVGSGSVSRMSLAAASKPPHHVVLSHSGSQDNALAGQ